MMNSIGLRMFLALVLGSSMVNAQVNAPGCTIEKNKATCDWSQFRKLLDVSHTIRSDYRDMDRATGLQLNELTQKLGKSVAKGNEKGDLTFTVVPAEISGVDVGPADEEILELRIYEGGGTSRGKLIWVETYRGQKDKPWPANVHEAIKQFRDRLKT